MAKKEVHEPPAPIALDDWVENVGSALRLNAQRRPTDEVVQKAVVETLKSCRQYWRECRSHAAWRDRGAKRPSSKKELEKRVADLEACWKTLSTLVRNLPNGQMDLLPDLRAALFHGLLERSNSSPSSSGKDALRFSLDGPPPGLEGWAAAYPIGPEDTLLDSVTLTLAAVKRLAYEFRVGPGNLVHEMPLMASESPKQWSTPLRVAHVRRLMGILAEARGEKVIDLKIGNPDTGSRDRIYSNPLLSFFSAANATVIEFGGKFPLYESPYTLRTDAIAIRRREEEILKSGEKSSAS